MTDRLDLSSILPAERALGAQRLAQYVARNRCGRYLRLALYPSEIKPLAARYRVGFETLSPLLSEAGQTFERVVVEELETRERVRNLQNTSAAAFVAALGEQTAGRTIYYQPRLEGRIGRVPCEGYPDLVIVERAEDGTVAATVVDVKASRHETVGFRLQVAFYARLLTDALAAAGLEVNSLDGAIFHRGAGEAGAFDADRLEKFSLDLYLDEIEQLVARHDSDAAAASAASFETARYHLGPHCDGCPYNALCFLDTAEREDLSLVPTLTATEKVALRAEGVADARTLAVLLDYARGAMTPAAGRDGDCERVAARWPLGRRLPVLAQRARAALRRLDRGIEAKPYLLTHDWGSLPDDAQYPNLVKIFVDAQRDHLQDRLYLLSALVAGPQGAYEITELAEAAPDDASERALLVAWVGRVLPSIARAADTESAPVHVYLFDRRGQRSLLDALARNFAALCAIPAFYDLLTSSPALTQGMISFLSDEVCGRLNLSAVCQNLYEVARELGFRWDDGTREITKTFHARVFDNTRPFVRDAATRELRPAERTEPGAFFAESAARFGTEIPLEYAYAAWGLLAEKPDLREEECGRLRQFAGTTPDDLRALASRRVRALRHVEQSFKYKSRAVEKQPLDLSRLDQTDVDPETVTLARALEDFLYLEHHARTQELMLHLSLPPAERALSGRTLVGRCASYEKNEGGELARFSLTSADGASVAAGELPALKLREGDWVVLNPFRDDEGRALPAWRLIRGRLAVVEELDESGFALRLLPMNFKNSEFRYTHRLFAPEPGALYACDEMADDLNADKFLEACHNADSNNFYRWLCDEAAGKSPRAVRPKRLRDAAELAALASRSQSPHELTAAQRRVVGDLIRERVVVLQGPPGTGKSHTLGFAVLARALALSTPSRPFRVAVCSKTHAATSIALGSVARGALRLKSHAANDARLAPLDGLAVVKVCNDVGEAVPEGVQRIFADGGEELSAAEQWAMLLEEPLLVVGGTPGGIFNLIKRGAAKGKAIDWQEKFFDLVVVDEASQMGLAEALTAAAFLREDGQFIAIGDHRQMPPILAHAWDRESRRDLERARPHLSVFEYLREAGFASAALDESFRIPAEIADFLRRHIYSEDGVDFRSANRLRLPAPEVEEDWLRAVFSPDHPLVIVEHDESGSQQSNEFEAALVEEIARAASSRLGLDAERGLGVVVPHRAQKALLQQRLPELAASIDTVERFQGGERDLIVVSVTVSDREFAQQESGFLLEPRRLTVAVSRPRRKLVVVSSRAVFDIIPPDLDEYERGALWKHLRHECAESTLWEGNLRGHRVSVRALKC
jgi:hypothetical protein